MPFKRRFGKDEPFFRAYTARQQGISVKTEFFSKIFSAYIWPSNRHWRPRKGLLLTVTCEMFGGDARKSKKKLVFFGHCSQIEN